jgi:6-phosphogluconolactonase
MCHTTNMNNIQVFEDRAALAQAAAKQTAEILGTAIEQKGRAVWVLAGGSTPLAAYKIIAGEYYDKLDWNKVTLVIGDERIGALSGPDNNWHVIEQILTNLPAVKLRPQSDQSAEAAAEDYDNQIQMLPTIFNGLPCFDLIWLGVGSDGHTLSLFPGHTSLLPASDLVIPVHDSPKPPVDRISLSLRALTGVRSAMIMASGADKQSAVKAAQHTSPLPIALAASIISTHGGKVTWLVDHDAAPTD